MLINVFMTLRKLEINHFTSIELNIKVLWSILASHDERSSDWNVQEVGKRMCCKGRRFGCWLRRGVCEQTAKHSNSKMHARLHGWSVWSCKISINLNLICRTWLKNRILIFFSFSSSQKIINLTLMVTLHGPKWRSMILLKYNQWLTSEMTVLV